MCSLFIYYIYTVFSVFININTTATDVFTSGGHAPYGRRHVVSSLAGVYASLAKPVLVSVYVLAVPTGRRSRLSADIGRESWFLYNVTVF